MNITEAPVNMETRQQIQACAADALDLLDLNDEADSATEIVAAVDSFVHQSQQDKRAEGPEDDELELTLGSLWGEQLVRALGWQWASVTFHDHDGMSAFGVFSPDRALAIYPFHFVYGCLDDCEVPVTILLAFNMLQDGSRIPHLPPQSYENVMDHVHPIVPGN